MRNSIFNAVEFLHKTSVKNFFDVASKMAQDFESSMNLQSETCMQDP